MRLLLDECVTSYITKDLIGHAVFTVEDAGFKGLKNGALLKAAAGNFDVLITVDQNLQYQQNLKNAQIAILVFRAPRSTYSDLKPLISKALGRLDSIEPGQVVTIS